jgi:hypothetical protein
LFEILRSLGTKFPIIFAGYSIVDSNMQHNNLTSLALSIRDQIIMLQVPASVVSRSDTGLVIASLRLALRSKTSCERSTKNSSTSRSLSAKIGGGHSTLRFHYKVAGVNEGDALFTFLETDAVHVRPGMPTESIKPKKFYRGYH